MSNPQNTVLNGPNGELTMAFKDAAHPNQDTNKVNQPGADSIQTGYGPRPQLQRIDSRVGLQQRPQFNPQFRPPPQQQPQQFQQPQQQFQQAQQQFQQNQQFQQQPNQQRPQFPGQGQIRPGPPPQRPLAPNQPPPQRQPIPPQNTTPRPQFIRPQQPRPPGPPPNQPQPQLPQQKSAIKTPNLEQTEIQAQIINKENDGNLKQQINMSSSPEMDQRRVSIGSLEENQAPPSRPESRASSVMKVIQENVTDKPKTLPLNMTQEKPPKTPENRMASKPPKPPSKKEGDNDSGVDESTQGNEPSTNGEHSPRKSARNTSRLTTPTKNRSFSRGSRSPNLKSPDSTPSTPGGEKKKLPMNKVQVGSAPSPNLKVVKSKIGSLANANYKPGGGNVKIETKKIDVSSAHSKIGAKNEAYAPSGGDKKIIHQKLQWNAKSKIGSLENATHKPKGGDKKIESVKLDFKEKAKPKVGSKDNMKHQPGGGDIKIETKKLNIKSESKVGSLDNMKHRPGGGDKKIFDDKDYLRQMSSGLSNENNSVCGSQDQLIVEVQKEEETRKSRPSSRLSRNNSLQRSTPRWKY